MLTAAPHPQYFAWEQLSVQKKTDFKPQKKKKIEHTAFISLLDPILTVVMYSTFTLKRKEVWIMCSCRSRCALVIDGANLESLFRQIRFSLLWSRLHLMIQNVLKRCGESTELWPWKCCSWAYAANMWLAVFPNKARPSRLSTWRPQTLSTITGRVRLPADLSGFSERWKAVQPLVISAFYLTLVGLMFSGGWASGRREPLGGSGQRK